MFGSDRMIGARVGPGWVAPAPGLTAPVPAIAARAEHPRR